MIVEGPVHTIGEHDSLTGQPLAPLPDHYYIGGPILLSNRRAAYFTFLQYHTPGYLLRGRIRENIGPAGPILRDNHTPARAIKDL